MYTGQIPDVGARQLAAVLAVAQHSSFVAAAAELRMSQPALTRTIKRVEDVLGLKLFERTTRMVRPTDAGREFIAVAQRIANDLKISAQSMRELADQQRGQVIVSTIMSVANGILPRAIATYRLQRPGIEIHIRDGIHGSVIDDVKSGAVDFGINYLQDIPTGLTAKQLGRGTFDLVACRESRLAGDGQTSIQFDDLRDVPLISMPTESQTRRVLDATAAFRGIPLRHAVIVSKITTLLNFVRAGVGIGLVPSTAITGDLGDGLVRLALQDPEISLDIGILRLTERSLSPAADGLMQTIIKNWQDD